MTEWSPFDTPCRCNHRGEYHRGYWPQGGWYCLLCQVCGEHSLFHSRFHNSSWDGHPFVECQCQPKGDNN